MAEVISMPKLGFDMAEGTLVRWVVGEGESIEKGQVLAEIETDKATVEVELSASGLVNRHLVDEGTVVPVGTAIAVIAAPGEEVKDLPETNQAEKKSEQAAPATVESKTAEAAPPAVTPVAEPTDGRIKASPLAKRIAEENGLSFGRDQRERPGRAGDQARCGKSPGGRPGSSGSRSGTTGAGGRKGQPGRSGQPNSLGPRRTGAGGSTRTGRETARDHR